MKIFIPRPYKLYNKIQHYDWGTKNENAFIPKFIGEEVKPNVPYAELWIGAHPKSPSEIELDNSKYPLDKVIEQYHRECLGNYVSKKFKGKFPFLLKVLSAARTLSIQTHPDKYHAEKLHAVDPQNYPDTNHKPEIAITIDSLYAIAGFRPVNEIVENLKALPELNNYVETNLLKNILQTNEKEKTAELIKEIYSDIMRNADEKEKLHKCITQIVKRLAVKNRLSKEESLFLKQHEQFGFDVGLFSFFFFNLVQLKSGEAIYTDAGIPHAYIKGNVIECMANSDNVVRAGLTNKYKDIDTLLEILRFEFAEYKIINAKQKADEVIYKTPADEFEVSRYHKNNSFEKDCKSNGKPSIYLVYDGVLTVDWSNGEEKYLQKFSKGESFFIPACLSEYRISSETGAEYFEVEIP